MASNDRRVPKALVGEDGLHVVPQQLPASWMQGEKMRVVDVIDETGVSPAPGVDNVVDACLLLTCLRCGFETAHRCPRCSESAAS